MRTAVVKNGELNGRQQEADQSSYDLCQERGPEDDQQTICKREAREVGLFRASPSSGKADFILGSPG